MFSASPVILSNGLMAMPAAPQGLVYNQLPDGTLIQMQPTGQNMVPTLMTSQMPILVNHQPGNPGQLIQASNGGTLLMSPSQPGLMQVSGIQQPQQPGQISPYQQGQGNYVTVSQVQMMPGGGIQQVSPTTMMTYNVSQQQNQSSFPSAAKTSPNSKAKEKPALTKTSPKLVKPVLRVESEDSDEEPLYATNDEESDDDEDDDVDDVIVGKVVDSKKVSATRKTIIQSNKVDSSGLKATPPHQTDETEQKSSSPGRSYT